MRVCLIIATATSLLAQSAAPVAKPAAAKPASRQPAQNPRQIQYPPLNDVKVPQPERIQLSNGMVVYLLEDRELPVVRATALIRAGSRWEPTGKVGLASITARVMRSGGTATRSGDNLDTELDRLGARVETGGGRDNSRAAVFVLKADVDKGLDILADVLRNPRFPQDKIDLAKTEDRDGISRRNEDPNSIAGREMAKLVYGKNSPYARHTEYETIDSITRDDLVAFHREYFQPENVILGVYGDFSTSEMKARIEKTLGSWPRGGRPKPVAVPVDPAALASGKLHLVNKEDINQSTMRIGMQTVERNHPDSYPLTVMTSVLSHRMSDNIRGSEGLAYFTGAMYLGEYDHASLWTAAGGTKSATTLQILSSTKREIEAIAAAEVKPDELKRAKDNILKGGAFDFDSTGKIVERLMTYEYFGYPQDYLQKYRANIEKVTAADVLRVAKKYLIMDRFTTLVVGKQKDFEKPLASLGAVTEIDVTIPGPKREALAAATSETTAKGKALLARARQAHGGSKLDAVKDYTTKADVAIVTPQGELTLKADATVSLTGKSVVKMGTPMGEMLQGFDGERAWAKTPQGVQDANASQVGEAKKAAMRETIALLRNSDSPALTVQSLGVSKVGDTEAEGVAISNPSAQFEVKVFVDPKTGLLAGKGFRGALMGAPADMIEVYSDYRDVDGIKVAFRTTVMRDGRKAIDTKLEDFKLNPGASDSIYRKP